MAQAKDHQEEFEGQWWQYPTLRNALLAGVLASFGFALAHLGFITEQAELVFYFLAIPLGGYHWALEGLERLFQEWEIGIDILMLAATAGSCILGLWDEAAFLVFLYGAAATKRTTARIDHSARGSPHSHGTMSNKTEEANTAGLYRRPNRSIHCWAFPLRS